MNLKSLLANDPVLAPPFHALELQDGSVVWVQVYVWSVRQEDGAVVPQPALEISANEIMQRDWLADFPELEDAISNLYTAARSISGLSSQARVNAGFLVFSAALDGRMFAMLPPSVQAALAQYRKQNDAAQPITVYREAPGGE